MASARNRSAAVAVPAVRCAVYCRKSTSVGLDQQFNSLDAQREAAENYIASQRHENWVALSDSYDDGGRSGATLERPALKRLLTDVEAGRIDCLVVYKYDRLSRSMLDFLQLLDFFKGHGVSFVSVSQRFDTSTPVGEMTLNMLLSFAQFERQIIAERTRDKVQAARRRGRWTGGMPPLGYDSVDSCLVINQDEAGQVRAIFDLYVEHTSLIRVVAELNRRGWRRKSWTTKTGRRHQGQAWDKKFLGKLLKNPLYTGQQKLGDQTFPGDHKAIVSKALFKNVQQLLDKNSRDGGAAHRNGQGFLLRGLLRCTACDAAMTPSWSRGRRRDRVYRYYVCSAAQKRGHATCPTKSVAADQIEKFIVDEIKRIGADPDLQQETFRQALAQLKAQRRGVKAEAKRLERDLAKVRGDVGRLVDTLTRTNGAAAEAIRAELEKAQEQVGTLEARQREVEADLAALNTQEIDEVEVARALTAFDPIWDVLLTPERERVLHLLIGQVTYDGQELKIVWRLGGFGELAEEIGDDQ